MGGAGPLCAYTMVESTETVRSRSSSVSACVTSTVSARSQVPLMAHMRNRW